MPYADAGKQKEYQRKWYARRRLDWLEKHGPCAVCASSENLEVDHVDPSTKTHHAIWSWSLARRLTELAKCQVLCIVCHFDKTVRENPNRPIPRRFFFGKVSAT